MSDEALVSVQNRAQLLCQRPKAARAPSRPSFLAPPRGKELTGARPPWWPERVALLCPAAGQQWRGSWPQRMSAELAPGAHSQAGETELSS